MDSKKDYVLTVLQYKEKTHLSRAIMSDSKKNYTQVWRLLAFSKPVAKNITKKKVSKMTLLEYEMFLRERTLSWVRKEIRKYKRSIYLEREDKAFCEFEMAEWKRVEGRIVREIKKIKEEIGGLE